MVKNCADCVFTGLVKHALPAIYIYNIYIYAICIAYIYIKYIYIIYICIFKVPVQLEKVLYA